MTDAVVADGQLTGDPYVFSVEFKLLKEGKYPVEVQKVVMSSAKGKGLDFEFKDGLFITNGKSE